MNADEFNLLKDLKFFSTFDDETLKIIITFCEISEIHANEILFKRGDDSDVLYIIVSGKLKAYIQDEKEHKVLGVLEAGEILGELGVLSGAPRSLNVQCMEDTKLLKISVESFKQLTKNYPVVLNSILTTIIMRSQQTIHQFVKDDSRQFDVIFMMGQQIPLETFIENLSLANKNNPFKFVRLSEAIFKQLESKTAVEHSILVCEAKELALIYRNLAHIKNIYLLVNNEIQEKLAEEIIGFVKHELTANKCKLIILHDNNARSPKGTKNWLDQAQFSLHHHVRLNYLPDYQRLARFIQGKPRGLVLSGGGAKGWAHVGVIKALQDNHIDIDAIAGTSVGSAVAACLTFTSSHYECQQTFKYLTKKCYAITSFSNLNWPILSLFNSRILIDSLQETFANFQIEDSWIPYFCVTANLSQNKEEIHARGDVWKKVLASNALPGVLPPVIINGQLHVDGGIVNNLAVDVMRNILGPQGLIIASNLTFRAVDRMHYDFPEPLSLKQILAQKLGFKKFVAPSLLNIMYNSFTQGALKKEQENALLANVLLNPLKEEYGIFLNDDAAEKKLFELGYDEMIKNIHNL